MKKRVFLIVLDSAGVGYSPDADKFDDVGADTFGTCVRTGRLHVPTLTKLGLFNIDGTSFEKKSDDVIGCYCKLSELSGGKDTTVGHWEIAGVTTKEKMPTYPNGFPDSIISEFEKRTGRKTVCNLPYSGTDVINDYGKHHIETGDLIVYTSADSVFQIAAHESIIPIEQLYEYCKIAREVLCGEHAVGRVIARPFIGEYPNFTRTTNRHDFSLEPPRDTIIDCLKKNGFDTIGVGKIYDIFAGKGISETYPNLGNKINMDKTIELLDKDFVGLCFVNLVDFDMMYGHRNDIEGYTNALNEVDIQLDEFISRMKKDDLLIITADHGCDPGYKGTDHSREYIPCLMYGENIKQNINIHIREGYSDIAKTISSYFEVNYDGDGVSFYDIIKNSL